MKLDDGDFETGVNCSNNFYIKIFQESDHSSDGGYTFEKVLNIQELDKKQARTLINELMDYLEQQF